MSDEVATTKLCQICKSRTVLTARKSAICSTCRKEVINDLGLAWYPAVGRIKIKQVVNKEIERRKAGTRHEREGNPEDPSRE